MDTVATTENLTFTSRFGISVLNRQFIVPATFTIAGKVENTDYTIDYRSGLVTRILGGSIQDNELLTASYTYRCTKRDTLVSKLTADIRVYNGYPDSNALLTAVLNAIDHLNTRTRYVAYHHLYLQTGVKVYPLPDNCFLISRVMTSEFKETYRGKWEFTGPENPTLVINFTPYSDEFIKLRYYGTHVYDSVTQAYNYITDIVADLITLKAKHLIYLTLASRSAQEAIKYTLADKSFDLTQQPASFNSMATRAYQEFENSLSNYIGRITMS